MRVCRVGVFCAVLILPLAAPRAADAPPRELAGELSLTGKIVHPQQYGLAQLQAMPSQDVRVSFDTEHGSEQAGFTGVPLWALIGEAGGIDDKAKGAVLRHTIKVTGRDGYFVVLSPARSLPISAPSRHWSPTSARAKRRGRAAFAW